VDTLALADGVASSPHVHDAPSAAAVATTATTSTTTSTAAADLKMSPAHRVNNHFRATWPRTLRLVQYLHVTAAGGCCVQNYGVPSGTGTP
jgi:hypothetical protein